jgi:chondroitin-sulfate-ABC endolyase/exolyase
MKKSQLFLFFFIFGISIKRIAAGLWHDWSSAKMSALTKINCTWQYSKTAVYQDSSLLVNYTPGASLTFPYNYTSSINTGGWFLMPFLDVSPTRTQDTMKVEFLLNSVVKATYKMNARKPGWNIFKVHQFASTSIIKQGFDTCAITGLIPDIPSQIRITFPKKTGSVYIGKVLLCNDATWTTLRMSTADSKKPNISPSLFDMPSTPVNITTAQQAALQQIATKMDEVLDVSPEGQVTSIPTATMTDLQTRFNVWGIERNGSIINGLDTMIFSSTPDYHTTTAVYGDLALEIAKNYRNTLSASDKVSLLAMFYDLFDYGIFVGGMYGDWNNGMSFAHATFLMREKLLETGRITPEVLSDFKTNIAYNRIFLPYSAMAKGFELYKGRVYRNGELGEDMDYLRITSHRLIMFNLLNTNLTEQVRDMTAISSYFSNIAFQYSPTILDGFKPDGTLDHHWGWIDGYGLDGLYWATCIIYALSDTEFKVSQPAYKLIYDALKVQEMRSLKNIVPATLTGKGGWPYNYGGNGQESIDRLGYMAFAGEYNGGTAPDNYMSQSFLRGYNNQISTTFSAFEKKVKTQLTTLGFAANTEPTGHKTLSYGAAFTHKRDNWIVSLKTSSNYQFVRESSDPWVTFLPYGMLEINTSTWLRYGSLKLQSDFGADGYDWRKMPGTTAINYVDITKMINKEYSRFWPNTTFVGGAMQDGNGVFTLQLPASILNGLSSFTGNKSYFCFDNNIVCMGSNISNTITSDSTITTLFQDAVAASDSTYLDNNGFNTTPYNYANYLITPTWLMNSHKVGYWLPVEQSLRLSRSTQNNKNWLNTATVSGTFATAWINHGKGPKNATYSYFMRINTTKSDMNNFDIQMQGAAPPFTILALTDKIQAVESANNNTYAAVVINATSNINLKEVISVSKPCVFMVKTLSASQKKLSISYPDLDFIDNGLYSDNTWWGYSNPKTLQVKLNGNWTLENSVSQNVSFISNVNNISTIQFTLKDGLTTDAIISKPTTANETIIKESDPQIIVYPNEISITFPDNGWRNAIGQIVSIDGKILSEFAANESITKVSTENFKPGVYVLNIKGDNYTESRKIVK